VLCNFVGNGHTATGQTEHDHVIASRIFLESLRELSPSFDSVWESSFHTDDQWPNQSYFLASLLSAASRVCKSRDG
jgi:hypothetical protein